MRPELRTAAPRSVGRLLNHYGRVTNEEYVLCPCDVGQRDGLEQCEPFGFIVAANCHAVLEVGHTSNDHRRFDRAWVGLAAAIEVKREPIFPENRCVTIHLISSMP